MRIPRRRFLHLAAGAAALPTISLTARAQAYPSRALTLVVPFPAGGPTDILGRIIAEGMRKSLTQPVVVENVSGANGSIGTGRVARAAGDGYTLLIGSWNTHVANGAVYSLPYDVLHDFAPISLISRYPLLLVAKSTMPASDLAGLIGWLKANPNRASWGTPGVGSIGHVAGVHFQNATGTRFQFVPYRGAAAALQDLVAGEIDIVFSDPLIALPQLRAGRIKALAISGTSRLATAPEIPTMREAGLEGLSAWQWNALFAPKGTPGEVIRKLNDAVATTLAEPAIRQKLTDQSLEIASREQQTPEALGALQKSEIEKWWPIIKAANVRGE